MSLPDQQIDFTPEFQAILDAVDNTITPIFITGVAGTGKSTLLRHFRDNTKRSAVFLAPTGVAALNVSGQTIHSFFRFPSRFITSQDVRRLDKKQELFKNLTTVVIDEISMVRADMIDAIDISLRLNCNEPDLPFGGRQILMFGDLFQLPPIIEPELEAYFNDNYETPYFFSARVFEHHAMETMNLTRIFRQRDPEFLSLLNKMRVNEITGVDLKAINSRVVKEVDYDVVHGNSKTVITLTATNARAADINQKQLSKLKSESYTFYADISGDFDYQSYPTDKELTLKAGAQVMLLRNDAMWVNGTLCTISDIGDNFIEVQLDDGSKHSVRRVVWEKIDYDYNPADRSIEPTVVGKFTQYPLKLAYGLTIHKVQGLTFDDVVIDLGRGAFAHGQTYVAFSRCRTIEGIKLLTPIRINDIIVDHRLIAYGYR